MLVTAATAVVAVIVTALVALPITVRSANNAARDDLREKSALAVELLATERQVARERIVARLRADGVDVYLIRRGTVDRAGLPDRVITQVARRRDRRHPRRRRRERGADRRPAAARQHQRRRADPRRRLRYGRPAPRRSVGGTARGPARRRPRRRAAGPVHRPAVAPGRGGGGPDVGRGPVGPPRGARRRPRWPSSRRRSTSSARRCRSARAGNGTSCCRCRTSCVPRCPRSAAMPRPWPTGWWPPTARPGPGRRCSPRPTGWTG